MVLDKNSILHLYRSIVKSAKRFPSIKRDKLVANIRMEFRQNASCSDPKKVNGYLELAIKGLDQLNAYSNLPKHNDW